MSAFRYGRRQRVLLAAVCFLAVGAGAQSRGYTGRLGPGSATLRSGEFSEGYEVHVAEGQRLSVRLHSGQFRPYLIVAPPQGEQLDNDGVPGRPQEAAVVVERAAAGGAWRILVTTHAAGETGDFQLDIDVGGVLAATAPPAGRSAVLLDRRGRLQAGDPQLSDGEYYHVFTFDARAGQSLAAQVASSDFDTYLILRSPSGDVTQNDDWEGRTDLSRIEMTVEEAGQWTAIVTSYAARETGEYHLLVDLGGGAAVVAAAPAPGATGAELRFSGRLQAGSSTLTSGEFAVEHPLTGLRAGEHVVIDMRAQAFDTYLILRGPNKQQWDNDDYEGDQRRSMLAVTVPEDGDYRILATSYAAGETGAYDITVWRGAEPASAGQGARVEQGRLQSGDPTLRTGEFMRTYTFEGRPGQRARVLLQSGDFDTYLMLRMPSGEQVDNDDAPGMPDHASLIEADLSEAGVHTVVVTSYRSGETGAYRLEIDLADSTPSSVQRDIVRLTPNQPVPGRLEAGDGQLTSGEYRDLYVFDGTEGQDMVLEMTSTDLDTYLILHTPGGDQIDNDDWEGRTDLSRIEMQLRETGRYTVMATSYATGETGAYQVQVRLGREATQAASGSLRPPSAASRGPQQVYGVFVGMSEYPDPAHNLPYCADDAVKLRDALARSAGMRAQDGIVLTDRRATVSAVRTAVRQLASRMAADDMLVFFFSGHGARQPLPAPTAVNPDGLSETIELYDGRILDDELAALFDEMPHGKLLLVIDACFSGGFSKSVISRPNRMGLFSSHEDTTSSVASKFRAGGFLSRFIVDAVGDRLADADGDGNITAIELSQYIYERYRNDVKSSGPGDYVSTARHLGYQQLVVDRGGVAPYQVLFAW